MILNEVWGQEYIYIYFFNIKSFQINKKIMVLEFYLQRLKKLFRIVFPQAKIKSAILLKRKTSETCLFNIKMSNPYQTSKWMAALQ